MMSEAKTGDGTTIARLRGRITLTELH